jgi:hypothetical protein
MNLSALIASTLLTMVISEPGLQKVRLQFKFPENSSYTVRSTSSVRQVRGIGGQEFETGVSTTVTTTSVAGKRGTDGRLPVEQKVDALAMRVSLPMGVAVEYDSSKPNAQVEARFQNVVDSFKARVGSSHVIVLGKNDEVVAVEGTERVLERATPATVDSLRAELKPERIKKAAEQTYGILPAEPVSKGDTWTRTIVTRIGGGQILNLETKFEYQGTANEGGKELDKIRVSVVGATYAIDEDAAAQFKVTKSNLTVESSAGSILFDRARGQPVESKSSTHLVGDMTLSMNGMEVNATLDVTLESNSVLQK